MISNQLIRDYISSNAEASNPEIVKKICNDNNISDKLIVISLRKRVLNQRKKLDIKPKEINEKHVEREETKDSLNLTYKGEKSITTLEQAIEFFEIDLSKYEVEKWICNSWDVTMKVNESPVKKTNYQVKLFLKPLRDEEKAYAETLDRLVKEVRKRPRFKHPKAKGSNVGVVCIADMHTGAKTSKKKGVINTLDFDLEHLIKYLDTSADLINERNYKEVHVSFLGDLIESLTGLNHINSWYSMEEDIVFGNAITIAFEIIGQFLSKINNVSKVYMVAGNHDRGTDRNDHDVSGTAAQLVAYMLKRDYDIKFHPMLISETIDNINYIFTHDHLKFSSKDLGKIFYEYGKQELYNVMASGHWHQSNSQRVFVKDTTLIQAVNYRAITVQPLFTGNYYSESIGYTGTPGLSIMEATENKDNIHHYELGL